MKIKSCIVLLIAILSSLILRLNFLPQTTVFADSINTEPKLAKRQTHALHDYADLQNTHSFALHNNDIVFSKEQSLLYYSLNDKAVKNIDYAGLGANTPLYIQSQNNYLFIISDDNKVHILNDKYNIVAINHNDSELTIYASHLAVYFSDTVIFVLAYQNNLLTLYTLDLSFNVSNIAVQNVPSVVSIDIYNNKVYALIYSAQIEMILEYSVIDFENTSPEIIYSKVIPSLNTTKIKFANFYDTTYLITLNNFNINNFTTPETNLRIYDFDSNNSLLFTKSVVTKTSPPFGYDESELAAITDFKLYENTIVVLDNITKSIKEFTFSKNENQVTLASPKTILGSNGHEHERYYNPEHILFASDSEVIISDTYNKRIQIITAEQVTVLEDELLYKPVKTLLDTNHNYVILNQNSIGNHDLLVYKNQSMTTLMSNTHILDIAIDINNNIYVLTHNDILIYNNYTLLQQTPHSTTNQTSKLVAVNNLFVIINTENMLVLNSDFGVTTQFDLTSLLLEPDFSVTTDFDGDMFVFSNNVITKLSFKDLQLQQVQQTVTANDKYNNIALNQETGQFIIFNTALQQMFNYENTNLSNGLKNYVHPVNLNSLPQNNQNAALATLVGQTNIYNFPNLTGNFEIGQENKSVVVLNTNTETGFSYIVYEKNYQLFTGYVRNNEYVLTQYKSYDNNIELVSLYKTKIYKLPTILKNQSDNLVILTADISTYFTPQNQKVLGLDGKYYYPISLNGQIGYITENDVIFENPDIIKPLIKSNASTFNINGTTVVYADSALSIPSDSLINGYEILIVENISDRITLVKYLDKYNNEKSGYIHSIDIATSKFNERFVTSAIILSVGIVFLAATFMIFAYHNKRVKGN